jgi:hypothetical protein
MLSKTSLSALFVGVVDVWNEAIAKISIDAVFLGVVVATNFADCAMIFCDEGSVDSRLNRWFSKRL